LVTVFVVTLPETDSTNSVVFSSSEELSLSVVGIEISTSYSVSFSLKEENSVGMAVGISY
jgi:hypothetical protein